MPPPSIKTASDIIMAYSIVTDGKVGEMHHFSVSRPPYLATPFGCNIVGMFGDRAGFKFPPTAFFISPNRVFHAFWIFSKQTLADDKKNAAELRAEKRKIEGADRIMGSAIKNSITLLKQTAPADNKSPAKGGQP